MKLNFKKKCSTDGFVFPPTPSRSTPSRSTRSDPISGRASPIVCFLPFFSSRRGSGHRDVFCRDPLSVYIRRVTCRIKYHMSDNFLLMMMGNILNPRTRIRNMRPGGVSRWVGCVRVPVDSFVDASHSIERRSTWDGWFDSIHSAETDSDDDATTTRWRSVTRRRTSARSRARISSTRRSSPNRRRGTRDDAMRCDAMRARCGSISRGAFVFPPRMDRVGSLPHR